MMQIIVVGSVAVSDSADEDLLATIPLFLGPWTGMEHIIMASYDIEAFAKTIQRTKATAAQISPSGALTIATTDLVERYDFSSIKHMTCGALPLKQDDYDRFLRKGNWKTVSLYGMTEAAPYVAWQKIREAMPLGKTGTILPNILCSLRLENGDDAPEGGSGELWLKGPNMAAGYVDNPEANRAAFDEAGWYNTGDVCTISPEGHLQVVGRTKELIKYNGFQVSPTELEAHLISHPSILDAAVGGTWDPAKMTELPTAYVVLKPHLKARGEKLRALQDIERSVGSQVSGYKKLRGGVFEVTELPRTPTFKLLRKQLGIHKTGLSSLDVGERSSKL
jgi:4-coumarate--CoA ligase